MTDFPRLLSLHDVASILNVSEATVLRNQGNGSVPAGIRVGSQWRWTESSIEDILGLVAS